MRNFLIQANMNAVENDRVTLEIYICCFSGPGQAFQPQRLYLQVFVICKMKLIHAVACDLYRCF